MKSRVLHVPGPIQRDIVTALDVRNDWVRVQQRHGDETYWLPTKIQGLGTILECVSGDDDAVVTAPPAPVTEEKKESFTSFYDWKTLIGTCFQHRHLQR